MLVRCTLLGQAKEVAGADGAEVELAAGATVEDLLGRLAAIYGPAFARTVRREDGRLAYELAILVGNRNVSLTSGLATPLREGDVVTILPVIAGG